MIILAGKREDIIKMIDHHPEITEVFIKVKPSTKMLAYLLNNTNLKKIYISKNIYRTIPSKVIRALDDMKIRVEIVKLKQGRPFEINDFIIKRAFKLKERGMSVIDISRKLGISRRTLYYRFNKIAGHSKNI
ncbi:hypothetical protein J7J26_02320 [Candidatus Micrarchaeota archaeon]|nr:hypothetical protein [Candidatus Micrarchaeota archaeon]